MKRIAVVAGLLLTAVALAGALRPEGAAAIEAPDDVDTVTVSGTGVVTAVPDRRPGTASIESRAPTARAALAANATAMRKVLDALRASGGKELTTQTVSLSTAFDQNGKPDGFVASNIASAETSLAGAGALIDAAVAAGANAVNGPSLSRSDAEDLYRKALETAVADARGRAAILAQAAGREFRPRDRDHRGRRHGDPVRGEGVRGRRLPPVVSGPQETTSSVSVSYELR